MGARAGRPAATDRHCRAWREGERRERLLHLPHGRWTEGIGPTFKGLLGRTEKLKDGSQITVDEPHLIDSIKNPDHQIVANFDPGSMPQTTLTDEEISQLVAYIKALK